MRRLMLCLALLALLAPRPVAARSRYFPETKQWLSGALLQFWETHGGAATLGLPIGPALLTTPARGRPARTEQSLERARLILAAGAAGVELAPLGADSLRLRGVDARQLPLTALAGPGCALQATGHQICGRLLAQWQRWPAVFGAPLSDLVREEIDGQPLVVQYFERARFELWPAAAAPDDLRLSRLESDRLAGRWRPTTLLAQPYYFFPVQPADTTNYGAFHHDYPATDMFTAVGSQFVAPTAGTIEYISRDDRWNPKTNLGPDRGGLAVSLVGDDGLRYYGSHLSRIAGGLAVGQQVVAGQLLGLTGKTGDARATDPHLHFGISHPTAADDWAVRRGEYPPFPWLQQVQRGLPVPPVIPPR